MTEKTVQEGIQDALQGLTAFANADVTINDWTILDQTVAAGPYAIIRNSDAFKNDASINTNTTWDIPVEIHQPFLEWSTSLNAFRETRSAVIDAFSGVNRSAGGISGLQITDVRNRGDIEYPVDIYVENPEEADPVFIMHELIIECEEF